MKSMTLILVSLIANAVFAFELKPDQGKVEFLAVGRPAAIKILGHAQGPTGKLELKRAGDTVKLEGKAELDLDQLDTGIGLRDRHMKEKYLETGKFKQATLTFSDVTIPAATLKSGGEATAKATLNVHGVEKPVDVQIKFQSPAAGQIAGEMKFKLKLTDHGIEVPKFSGITVADEVEVTAQTTVPQTALGVTL